MFTWRYTNPMQFLPIHPSIVAYSDYLDDSDSTKKDRGITVVIDARYLKYLKQLDQSYEEVFTHKAAWSGHWFQRERNCLPSRGALGPLTRLAVALGPLAWLSAPNPTLRFSLSLWNQCPLQADNTHIHMYACESGMLIRQRDISQCTKDNHARVTNSWVRDSKR